MATKSALDQLIKDEVSTTVTSKKLTGKAKTDLEKTPLLNQAQVHNIVKKLYKVDDSKKAPPKSAKKPEKPDKSKSPTKGDKKDKKNKNDVGMPTLTDNAPPPRDVQGSYADFYKDTKAMAKSKNWSDEQMTVALADRPKTEA